MNIIFLDQTGQLGGAEVSLGEFVPLLPHRATVLLFEPGPLADLLSDAGVRVEQIASRNPIKVRRGDGLLRAARYLPACLSHAITVARHAKAHDLVYANSLKAFFVGAVAALLSRRPLVWNLRDILDPNAFNPTLRWLLVRLANGLAARIIVNSRATMAAFHRAGGRRERVELVYPGIDAAKFDASFGGTLRIELGAGERPMIGLFGRLVEWKGQKLFLDVMARTPGAIGIIVGGPLFGEHAFEAELHEIVRHRGLGERVCFLGHREDTAALMRQMDVIVHCSLSPEPFGRVIVEGMMAGRPVIAAAGGGVLEIIEDGVTGWLYEPGNADALAGKIAEVLADPDRAARIAAAGRVDAARRFSVKESVRQIEAVLAGLDRRRKQEAAVVEIPMRPQPEDSIAEPEEAG